jgi:nitrogen fixation-related uncharacterized protein
MSAIGYILIFGVLAALGASVVWALWWAFRGGQMSNFQKGAESIFDADEPIGRPTDAFPQIGEQPQPQHERNDHE